MKQKVMIICAASFAIAAFGEYSYENDNKTYVVTVAAGSVETLASGDDAAAVLNANGVTNFVKRGGGTLKVSADLSSFTGDLYVEDGVYASSPQTSNAANTTAGAIGTEYKIFVLDGATFDFNTEASGHSLSREWHLRGHGYNDPVKGRLGALHSTASGTAMSAVTGMMILEGETTMRFSGGGNVVFFDCPIDMKLNTLVLKSDAQTVGPIVQCRRSSNAGDVIIDGCANLTAYTSWLSSNPAGTHSLIVNTNSTLLLNSTTSLDAECTATHGLVLRKGAKIELVGGGGKYFQGPITFEDPVRNIITSRAPAGKRYSITFYGNNSTIIGESGTENESAGNELRGSGFKVEGNTMVQVYHPGSGSFPIRNLMTNGMTVANGGVFDISGRGLDIVRAFNLSSDGGDIEVSGGTVAIDNHYYEFAKWGNVLRFSGENCVWAGYPFYNYENVSTTPVSSSYPSYRNSLMFNTLDFKDNPSIAFSTNVVVLTLNGVGSVSNTVDKSKVYGYTGSGVKCCAFKVHTAWNLDVADVRAGSVLATDGRLDFSSGVKIRLTGTGKVAKPYSRVIAYAEQGINWGGTKTFEVEDSGNWRLSVGDDGKTILATYLAPGFYITFH